ncbi:MAG: Twitching motility protein PilT [uncultured Campylobacterales bacterium]|uniref:Twitching motility protein PilT n=1 Tax=uncultured Campylobacterales bacterium TaxID=352960 RepID=A0A6S6SG19_9BACT|nr:MAG: Twitching motility protein PilT [uncultured Campylobacterales bacterium]
MQIKELLEIVAKENASDLHIVANSKPQIRVHGELIVLEQYDVLTEESSKELCMSILTDKQKEKFEGKYELDFSIEFENLGRFRANYYYTVGTKLAAAFRIIPQVIPSLDELKLPEVLKNLTKHKQGLILVTGPTGSGKSTTLAAMLNEINITRKEHILTIEDPVEFLHTNKKSLYSHREVGANTDSFASGLKYALRQDPDVILVGELRDRETISIALTAAETGHLVLGTMHTNSAIATVNRILDNYDGNEQIQIRNMLSSTMVAMVGQTLIPRVGGGRVAVHDILINNTAVANLVRENKTHQLYSQMQLNQSKEGMLTQATSILEAYRNGTISKDDALEYAFKPEEVKLKI